MNFNMHRDNLTQLLNTYNPTESSEIICKRSMLDFISMHADCFERSCIPGHFTGSCWLVNASFDKALLTHHAKLDIWLQLGGHCDGISDLLQVALQEAKEESGLNNIVALSTQIFDIDVHEVPARKNEARHMHYDVRFLLQTQDEAPVVVSAESKDLLWINSDINSLPTNHISILRMFYKWQAMIKIFNSQHQIKEKC